MSRIDIDYAASQEARIFGFKGEGKIAIFAWSSEPGSVELSMRIPARSNQKPYIVDLIRNDRRALDDYSFENGLMLVDGVRLTREDTTVILIE